MAPAQYVPQRGDAVWLNFEDSSGHEQTGRRPALVLSPRTYNDKSGLAVVCPVTSRSKGYPFEVKLPADLPLEGVVLADQVRTVDWRARRVRRICEVSGNVVEEVGGKLRALLP